MRHVIEYDEISGGGSMNKTNNTELPIIDWGQETQLAHNASGLTNELLIMFAAQLPETQSGINQAFAQKNYEELNDRLHKLQGGCVYCGLLRLKAAISELTQAFRATQTVSQQHIDQINHELDAVMAELRNKKIIS